MEEFLKKFEVMVRKIYFRLFTQKIHVKLSRMTWHPTQDYMSLIEEKIISDYFQPPKIMSSYC